jgi:hypothetical protein
VTVGRLYRVALAPLDRALKRAPKRPILCWACEWLWQPDEVTVPDGTLVTRCPGCNAHWAWNEDKSGLVPGRRECNGRGGNQEGA